MIAPAQQNTPRTAPLMPPQALSPSPLTAHLTEGPHLLLESLADEWNALVSTPSLNQPFLYPYWFLAFAKTFHAGRPVSLITVRDQRRLVGVLPLRRTDTFFGRIPGRTLSSLAGIHSCRFDLICEPSHREGVNDAIWECLKRRKDWDVLEAHYVPQDSALDNLLRRAEKDGYLTATWPTQKSPYLTLPSPGSPPLQNCPARYADSRKRLGRYERRLRDHGEPSFEVETTFSDQLFESFLEMEGSGWKGKAGSAIKCSSTTTQFYREALRDASTFGQLRMCSLLVSGREVAMEMALLSNGICFSPKVAYDETLSNASPGNLLVQRIISDLVQSGVTRYDLLGSQGRHKAMWAGEVNEHASLYIFRPTLTGHLRHTLVDKIATKVKALKHRMYGDPQSLDQTPKKKAKSGAS
jgi:CelD/BcsL family acetyltransferase involved in cellulose biosynthesis